MGDGTDGDLGKIIGILKSHSKYGLTLTELMSISELSHSTILNIFEEIEDMGKLSVKSDGLSRIYMFKEN